MGPYRRIGISTGYVKIRRVRSDRGSDRGVGFGIVGFTDRTYFVGFRGRPAGFRRRCVSLMETREKSTRYSGSIPIVVNSETDDSDRAKNGAKFYSMDIIFTIV